MNNQVIRVVDALCEDVGTPRALAVKLLVGAGEWVELQKLRVRPQDYQDNGGLPRSGAEAYFRDCLVTDLLRKCDLPTTVDREGAARSTFLECEQACAATNVRLTRYLPETLYLEDGDMPVYEFITRWRKEVDFVLGNLPVHLTPRFSSGATYADTGKLITTPDKMSSTPTIYPAIRDLLPFWRETSWYRALCEERPWQSDPEEVRGNIFFTVPKDGTKFRGCCKEASLAVAFQLDVGREMKKRLLRINVDLQKGQAYHREIARFASIDQTFATIDMSNASDTVCRVLPKLTLRGDWWELLNSLRATHTRVDKTWYRLEKFSSMGNGFTFELETVLFVTLARCVVRDEGGDPDLVSCYGDDLIVPSYHYKGVMAALRMFGFQPNMNKTFAEGPFRESCGGDFFDGVPVRAHYIEELPDEPQQWISLANGLRRVAFANNYDGLRWRVVLRAWLRALDPLDSDVSRCRGPETLGDVVIHDEPRFWGVGQTEAIQDWDPSWSQQFVPAYLPVYNVLPWKHWYPAVQLASCTLGLPSDGVTPRDDIIGWRIGSLPVRGLASWLPRPMDYGSPLNS